MVLILMDFLPMFMLGKDKFWLDNGRPRIFSDAKGPLMYLGWPLVAQKLILLAEKWLKIRQNGLWPPKSCFS